MLALMPRCIECVLCGQPLAGKGRIDRIYCSASCRTLAWRARAGHRFDGRRKAKLPPQPGDFIARKALPLLAVRVNAELAAAKKRIAELENQLAERRGGAADAAENVAIGAAAAAGAIGLAAALMRRNRRSQQADQTPDRAEVEAERQKHQAELTTEQERAARREAELRQQVSALTARAEHADARAQATAASLSTMRQGVEALRQKLDENENITWRMRCDLASVQAALVEAQRQARRHQETLIQEARQRQSLQFQLNEARRHIAVQRQELEAVDARFAEESRQLHSLQAQLATARRQLGAERRQWQATRAQLMQHVQNEQHQLMAENSQLRLLLVELESRAQVAAGTISRLQLAANSQEHRYLAQLEEIQRKQLIRPADERRQLPAKKKPKQLAKKKKHKQLPEQSGIVEKVLMTAISTVAGAAVGLGLGLRLGDGDKKRLPPKEVGTYFEVTPVPERKRLPPKRD